MCNGDMTVSIALKELKLGIHSDRLNCHNFTANQFRLLLSQAAYILLLVTRQAASETEFATVQVERLRSMLIKGQPEFKFPHGES